MFYKCPICDQWIVVNVWPGGVFGHAAGCWLYTNRPAKVCQCSKDCICDLCVYCNPEIEGQKVNEEQESEQYEAACGCCDCVGYCVCGVCGQYEEDDDDFPEEIEWEPIEGVYGGADDYFDCEV